jgi:YHYH protein
MLMEEFKVPVRVNTSSPAEPATPPAPPSAEASAPEKPPEQKSKKKWLLAAAGLVLIAGAAYFFYPSKPSQKAATTTSVAPKTVATTVNVQGVQLDVKKNYGNKYASGILPVGDTKYVTDTAKQGYVYACSSYAHNLQTSSGGASQRGPWFSSDGTAYDLNKKTHVGGSVSWQPSFSDSVQGTTRVISSNDLPNHPTGVFPIAPTDPAYAYDRNPNSIKAQTLSYSLSASPTYGSPQCMGGQAGIMLTGVALFNGFDAGGRDAGAWEVQDGCSGHPEKTGTYHYHTLSSCIKDTSVKTVIGFALDGFPITGPKVADGNILTTSDLDECHGLTSQIVLDGKSVTSYHYVMTQDFPYSVSCFRAQPVQPPGQPAH